MTDIETAVHHRPDSLLRVVPSIGAGVAAIGMALYQVLTPGAPQATFGSALDFLRDGLFLLYLVASIAAMVLARRQGLLPGIGAWLVGVGYGLLVIGVGAGLVLQRDPEWFGILGLPGNLLAMAGFITAAIVAWRARRIPGWVTLLLAVGGFFAVLATEFGTSVLIGCFWLWTARGVLRPARES
ncbi:hypothetical protein [Streptomyces brasiliensis]|nr:hypothetical protein [Streptomyces brasiliensis]